MADDQQKSEVEEVNSDFSLFPNSLDNLTLLAQGIPHSCVVEMVKGLRSLEQAFKGFRTNHLPRKRVPGTLAKYALNNPERTERFVKHWFHSKENAALRLYVSKEVDADNLRQSIIKALARAGVEKRELLLCALLLDQRSEVREAIGEKLRQELLDDNSELVGEAKTQRQELEQKWQAEQRLKTAEEEAAEARRQLEEREQKLERLQEQIADFTKRADEAKKNKVEIEKALQNTERESGEQRLAAETALAKQHEAEALCRQLKEQNAEMQMQLQGFGVIQERVAELEASLNTVQVLKKNAEMRCRHLEKERDKIQLALDDERKHPHHTISLAFLDESWRNALSLLAAHLRTHAVTNSQDSLAVHPNGASPNVPVHDTTVETTQRANDWQCWQKLENDLVHCLLDGSLFDSGSEPLNEQLEACLSDATRAQKLLALRWYLLEGFRQRVIESLATANMLTGEAEGRREESEPIRRSTSL